MVCPIWNGVDTAGRRVAPDSFWTKNAGCNSAEDRVVVENNQRPQYMEYINLSANGIDGSMYGANGGSPSEFSNSMPWNQVGANNDEFNYPLNRAACQANMGPAGSECYSNANNITGNFGTQLSATNTNNCGVNNYRVAMSQVQNAQRLQNIGEHYQNANNARNMMNNRRY